MSTKAVLRRILMTNPHAFRLLWRRKENSLFERRVVRKGDDIVIEGFPRSGNTFATAAFRLAQRPREIKIGNHFHAAAQVSLAYTYGIPALIVFREPKAASLSLVTYSEGRISPEDAINDYIAFHTTLMSQPESFVPAPFNEVTQNFAPSIKRLNARFGTSFEPYYNTPESDEAVRQLIEEKRLSRVRSEADRIASEARKTTPSKEKAKLRLHYQERFDTPKVRALTMRAEEIYARVQEHKSLKDLV